MHNLFRPPKFNFVLKELYPFRLYNPGHDPLPPASDFKETLDLNTNGTGFVSNFSILKVKFIRSSYKSQIVDDSYLWLYLIIKVD